ncbi:hypothetical protein EAI_05500 [Harpegnathos saltator]|uniref:Uncharacterized protein n=1 Tax=Harpegnathos saltator TaxID=610380 RepID=E2BM33_HARSA|nr:hypothetical protein EAI_05500 [Harpegnathos saltator]
MHKATEKEEMEEEEEDEQEGGEEELEEPLKASYLQPYRGLMLHEDGPNNFLLGILLDSVRDVCTRAREISRRSSECPEAEEAEPTEESGDSQPDNESLLDEAQRLELNQPSLRRGHHVNSNNERGKPPPPLPP